MTKKVYLASDHEGFELKESLSAFLSDRGFDVEDLGPSTYDKNDDYPLTIASLARAVAEDKEALGIGIGLSGQGEAMAANRVLGARAAVYYGGNAEILKLSREHNNANILSLSSKFVSPEQAKEAAILWLMTPFSGEERHLRRIAELG